MLFFFMELIYNYNKDFNYFNKVKSNINYICNILLLVFSDYSYVVSNSLTHMFQSFIKKSKLSIWELI